MKFNLTPKLLCSVLDAAYSDYTDYTDYQNLIKGERDEAYVCGLQAEECRKIAEEFGKPLDVEFAGRYEEYRWLELAQTYEEKAEALQE